MDAKVQIAGRSFFIGEEKRGRMTLREQEESLKERYEEYDFICVSHGVIRFFYTKEKE